MSYRAAWGKIKKTEKVIGVKLIKKGGNRFGYHLAQRKVKLMNQFDQWKAYKRSHSWISGK